MASTGEINEADRSSLNSTRPVQKTEIRYSYPKLSLLNGLLFGLTLVLGVWGWKAISLLGVPVPLQYPSLIVAGLLLVALCGMVGWLTGRFDWGIFVFFAWLVAGVISTLIIVYQPTFGRTFTVWIANFRFWGLPIYPSLIESLVPPVLAGFFVILVFGLLALLQNYRLESIAVEVNESGRLQSLGWLLLCLPLPIVFITGAVTNSLVGDLSAQALQLVNRAIPVVLNQEGDLFALSLEDGLNYSAFNSVRDQLAANYILGLGESDSTTSTTYVVVNFDNGAWVNCRLLNNHLSFCFDAAPPYTMGLASLITGAELPEPCLGCLPQVDEPLQTWLGSQGDNFEGEPQIERVAQWGSYVLMRAESEGHAIECWFHGFSPVQLTSCTEVDN